MQLLILALPGRHCVLLEHLVYPRNTNIKNKSYFISWTNTVSFKIELYCRINLSEVTALKFHFHLFIHKSHEELHQLEGVGGSRVP